MNKPLDPMSVERKETPSASYVLRRRYGRARPVITIASWVTVINLLLQPVAVLAATWDANGATVGQTDGAGVWKNASMWWTGSENQTWVSGDDAIFGWSGAGGAVTLASPTTVNSLTLNTFTGTYTLGTAGQAITLNSGLTMNSGAGAVTIISPITLGGVQSWTNNDDSLLTLSSTLTNVGDTAPYTLTLNGTGTGGVTFSGIISNGGTTGTTALIVNAPNSITTLSSANTFTGGTTLTSGTIGINASSTPTIGPFYTGGSGPLGTGTLTINGGSTVKTDTTARTIANDLAINTSGTVTFGAASGAAVLTINGKNQSIAGGPTLSFNTVGTTFGYYPMGLNSDVTLTNTGTGAPTFAGGLTVGGAAGTRTITDSMSTTLTISGPLTLNQNLTFAGTHIGVITMTGITETIVGSGGITLAFSDSNAGNGLTSFTTGPLILGGDFTLQGNSNKKPTVILNGLRVASGAASTFTLENDTAKITLTLGSGANNEWILGNTLSLTLSAPATAQTIAATLVGSGGLTLNNGSAGVTLSAAAATYSPLFTGTVTVGDGSNTTQLFNGVANGLPIFGNYVLAGGTTTLDIKNVATQIGSLASSNTSAIVTNSGVTASTLFTVGNASNTTYAGAITGTNKLALTKIGSGSLALNGVNTYTGLTTVSGGTLQIGGSLNGTTGTALTFGGTGTFNVAEAADVSQGMGTLTFTAGDGTVISTRNAGSAGNTAVTFSSFAARAAGATGNFIVSGGVNGTSNKITFTTITAGFQNQGVFFGGDNYAYANAANSYVRGINYAGGTEGVVVSTGTLGTGNQDKHVQITTTSITAQDSVRDNTINIAGAYDITLNGGATLTLVNAGIFKAGGGASIISGGTAVTTSTSAAEYVIRTDGVTDTLTINTPITANGVNALTKSGAGTLTLGVANAYTGAVYVNGGILSISANDNLGPVATTKSAYLNGGTLQFTSNVNLYNGTPTTNPRAFVVGPAGATLDIGSNSVDISGVISSGLSNAGLLTKTGTGGTLTLRGANTFTGGFSFGGGNLILGNAAALGGAAPNVFTIAGATVLDTTGTAITVGATPMRWNADFTMAGNASATATANDINLGTGAVLLGGNRQITVGSGSNYGTLTVGGVIHDGGNAYSLEKLGAGTMVLSGNSTYSGGTTLSAGTLALTASSTGTLANDPAPGVVYGPLGTGALTLNGGTFRSGNTTGRIIHNSLAINGNVTLGDMVNNGVLIFNGATQTIAAGSTVTALSAVTFGIGLTIGDGVSFYGPGLVTLQPQTVSSSSSNPVIIGDNATFSGNLVGGNVSVGSQAALGAGSVTINYGGTLTLGNVNYANTMTVNAGGAINLGGANNTGSGVTVNSMATVGNSTAFAGTWPKKGVILMNAATTSTSALGPMDGTLAIGGIGALAITPQVTLSNSAGTARTLAFNGAAATTFTGGLSLNADLTVAGAGGVTSFTGGFVNNGNAAWLGAITQDGTPRAVTINLIPSGIINWTANPAFTGGLTIKSGLVSTATGSGGGTSDFGGTVYLDGGGVRVGIGGNGGVTIKDNFIVKAGGGSIAVQQSGNVGTYTFTGSITPDAGGAGPVTLRGGGTGAHMIISGDNSAFAGGFNLAANVGANGCIRFSTDKATGAPGNTVTVPAGLWFGFENVANYNGTGSAWTGANLAKFSTVPNSILDVANLGTIIDLNAWGKDVRLGGGATWNDTYTITPYASTYNFTPTGFGTIAITGLNRLTGADKNVDVSAGVVSAATTVLQTGTLSIQNAQDYTGATTIHGQLPSSVQAGWSTGAPAGPTGTILLLTNNGTTSSGDLSATSGITIDRYATLKLAGYNATGPQYGRITKANVPITVKGGATLVDGDDTTATNNDNVTDRIVSSATLTLGGNDDSGNATGGGTFNLRYPGTAGKTHAQTLASLTIAAGSSTIAPAGTAAGTATLTFTNGTFTRTAPGGVVTITAQSGNWATVLSGNTGNAFLGPWAFVGNTYAATDGSANVIAYAANTNNINDGANKRFQNTAGGTYTLSGANTLQTINFITNGNDISLAGFNLELTGGGILNQSGAARAINTTGGTLTSSYNPSGSLREMVINDVNGLTINPQIVQNGGQNIILTKLGAGILTLANSANQIGDLYLLGGGVQSNAQGAIGTGGTINLLGGALYINGTQTYGASYPIVVGPQGGWIVQNSATAGSTATFQGSVTLNGALILYGTNVRNTNPVIELSGNISGDGVLSAGTPGGGNPAQTIWKAVTILGGNNTFTGGIILGQATGGAGGTVLRLASPTAAGAGPMFAGSGNGTSMNTIAFVSGFGTTTLANDISTGLPLALVNWMAGPGLGASGGNIATVSGRLYGATSPGGLTLQGYATSDTAISETVLAGSLSLTGTPVTYNWGTTTAIQNFVNAAGGIMLGATGIQGASALVVNSPYRIDLPGGTYADNGALGFVRFANPEKSMLPGAVGPGYVAALHKGGDTAGEARFGYLLTGTGGSGTTYTLPEGKSFVIGSLGSGTQVGGTFGSAGGGTATFLGNAKLAGAEAGDINIHANAATDAQSLNILTRAAGDTLVLGDGSTPVVFTPTYGDSGTTSAITLMRDRTGNTTINKTGAGTLLWNNASVKDLSGAAIAAGKVTVNVNVGTLGGTGTIGGAVVVAAGATLKPGTDGSGTLNVSALTVGSSATVSIKGTGGTTCGKIASDGPVSLSGTLALDLSGTPTETEYVLVSGTTLNATTFTSPAANSSVTWGGKSYKLTYTADQVKLVQSAAGTAILFK